VNGGRAGAGHAPEATLAAVGEGSTIVVVEDDPAIADVVDLYLRRDGHRVLRASDGDTALALISGSLPALAILDVGLPDGPDGFEVCRRLRALPRTADLPVILLTARDDEVDRVVGLELGADDYVTKPFSPRELVARVKAVLRRTAGSPTRSVVITVGQVEVDLGRREARVDGEVVPLATREFDLLVHLARHAGLALTRRQLLDGVWGVGWVGDDRTVDVHVRQLRRKLGDALDLATVWGVGYRLG
jgi:DNA-binding response OmpR family regulator